MTNGVRARSLAIGACVLLLSSLYSQRAAAQTDEAGASVLFDKGLADMQAGRHATGCPAIAESYRLDPKAGALFTLAECEAQWGKLATAVAHYDDYLKKVARMPAAQRASQVERESVARSKLDSLRPQVPQLTLVLPPGAPSGAVVFRDGVTLGAPSVGEALPVDPGEHVLAVEAGGARKETRITLAPSERRRVVLELPVPGTAVARPPREDGRARPPADADKPAPGRSSQRLWGFVALGTGAVAAGAGALTGVLVLQRKSTIDEHCVGTACDAEGKSAADAASTLGTISTISFAVGGAALVLGAVLLLTDSPAPSSSSAKVGVGPSGVRVVF